LGPFEDEVAFAGAVSVIDHAGKRLKIPVWLLSPDSSGIRISERVHLSKEALLL
jgi:hypothetical protein